jgi:hypothetical protein
MRRLLSAIAPCLILPIFCFVVLSYQSLNREIKARLPLLTTYYLSNQLTTEIVTAQQREPREFPPNYRKIIQDYRSVTNNEQIAYLKRISDQVSKKSLAETLIARFVLWRKSLPLDFLDRDPVGEIENQLRSIQKQERLNSIEREKIVITHSLVCLRQRPGPQELVPTKRGLPDEIFEKGLVFCGEKIPLERADVRKRIEYQIAYLLADFRDTTSVWIRRKDRYGEAIRTILKRERVPP